MKPTKEQMLERIYEVIADKTLSFGCNVHHTWRTHKRDHFQYITNYPDVQYLVDGHKIVMFDWKCFICECHEWWEHKIIWHPIMIGDVLDWIRVNIKASTEADVYMKWPKYVFEFSDITTMRLLWMWVAVRKPIDDQSDETIAFVYGLLPTK